MTTSFNCPQDLKVGDTLEIQNLWGNEEITTWSVVGVDTADPGCFRIVCGGRIGLIDPVVAARAGVALWRRVSGGAEYGVNCSSCNDWFPHAEAKPGFRCFGCRS